MRGSIMHRPIRAAVVAAAVSLLIPLATAAGAGAEPNVVGGPGARKAVPAVAAAGAWGAAKPQAAGQFVQRDGDRLVLAGRPYRFAGTNNYYPMYKSTGMVDSLFGKAAASGFDVIRVWGSREIGNADGTSSVDPPSDGFYLQYWDQTAGKPAFNDGLNGFQHLDYVLAAARAKGLRLVIPLVNNWNNFGGMDQYVRWAGGTHHDDFYTNATIRGWYKAWIAHVLNRVNPLTGIAYKDDPTVLMWELGNEPRCLSAGAYPRSTTCNTDTLVNWAGEMSGYIKSVDRKHLVGVGDEGFYNKQPTSTDFTHNGADGVDTLRLAALRTVDVMSFHLYPDGWKQTPNWGTGWITEHVRDAHRIGKPAFLGEFGLLDKATRNPVYRAWTDAFIAAGGTGELYWLLSDVQDDGTLYADYDGFTVYCPGPVCTTLGNAGTLLRRQAATFPPVADADTLTAEFGKTGSVQVTANDTAYRPGRIAPSSVDLDPATSGRQTSVGTAAGTVATAADGTVTFTPATGYVGRNTVRYTVADSLRRTSTPATITIIAKPDPTGVKHLFSFEDGTQGWAEQSWSHLGGTVTRTTAFATDGSHGAQIDSKNEWFGVDLPTPLDLGGASALKADLKTGDVGTSVAVVLKTGTASTWCQGPFVFYGANATQVVQLDLLTGLSCENGVAPDLAQVRGVYLYFNTGSFLIDDIRAQ